MIKHTGGGEVARQALIGLINSFGSRGAQQSASDIEQRRAIRDQQEEAERRAREAELRKAQEQLIMRNGGDLKSLWPELAGNTVIDAPLSPRQKQMQDILLEAEKFRLEQEAGLTGMRTKVKADEAGAVAGATAGARAPYDIESDARREAGLNYRNRTTNDANVEAARVRAQNQLLQKMADAGARDHVDASKGGVTEKQYMDNLDAPSLTAAVGDYVDSMAFTGAPKAVQQAIREMVSYELGVAPPSGHKGPSKETIAAALEFIKTNPPGSYEEEAAPKSQEAKDTASWLGGLVGPRRPQSIPTEP